MNFVSDLQARAVLSNVIRGFSGIFFCQVWAVVFLILVVKLFE